VGINWRKVGKVALTIGSVASSFTGIGWLGLAVKGGTALGSVLTGDETAADAGMKAFEELVAFADGNEKNSSLDNARRKELLDWKIGQFAGDADIKDRHIGLVAMVVLAAVHGEMSLDEAAALLNVDD